MRCTGGLTNNHPMEEPVETTTGLDYKQDPMEMVVHSIDNLYMVRDTFFPLDPSIKRARLENLLRDVLLVLNEMSSGLCNFLFLSFFSDRGVVLAAADLMPFAVNYFEASIGEQVVPCFRAFAILGFKNGLGLRYPGSQVT